MITDPLVLLHLCKSIISNMPQLEASLTKCLDQSYPGGEPPIERVIEAARPVLAFAIAAAGRPLSVEFERYSSNSVLTQGPASAYLSPDDLESAGIDIEDILSSADAASNRIKTVCQKMESTCRKDYDHNDIDPGDQIEFLSACRQLAQAMIDLDPMSYA